MSQGKLQIVLEVEFDTGDSTPPEQVPDCIERAETDNIEALLTVMYDYVDLNNAIISEVKLI